MTIQEIRNAQNEFLDAQEAIHGANTELTETSLQAVAEAGIIIYYTVSPNLPSIPKPSNG